MPVTTYLLLLAPSANRVYAEQAPALAAAEARLLCPEIEDVRPVEVAGVAYLELSGPEDLDRSPGLGEAFRDSFMDGMGTATLTIGLVCLVGAIAAAILLPGRELDDDETDQPAPERAAGPA